MEKYSTIEELMEAWLKKHHDKRYRRFVYDGIVDESVYRKSPVRVCYVLKECYLTETDKQNDVRDSIEYHKHPESFDYGAHHWIKYIKEEDGDYVYSLVENLKQESNWYMWHRVEHLTDIIFKAYKEAVKDTFDDDDYIKTNRKIAVIDIKKSSGNNYSSYDDILDFAKEDKDLLLEEIRLVGPNVLFFGGTFDICIEAGLIDEARLEKLGDIDATTGFRAVYLCDNKLLIDAYHPTARGISYNDNLEALQVLTEAMKELQ